MQRGGPADDRQVQEWLDLLRHGSESEKVMARRGLAGVFEQRGMLEEATDLLTANVKAGAADAATYRWLARLYRARGEATLAAAAASEASRLVVARHPPRAPGTSRRPRKRPGRWRATVAILLLLSAGAGVALAWLLAYLFPT